MNTEPITKLLEPLRNSAPIIIEILGTPNAGKTIALRKLENLLTRSSQCRVSTIYETAALCPIKEKYNPAYCEWIACETMQRLLERLDSGSELILCERGLVDILCWRQMYLNDSLISPEQYEAGLQYTLNSKPFSALRFVVVFTCEPAVAVEREYPSAFHALPGKIVNVPIVTKYNEAVEEVFCRHADLLPRYVVMDTTRQTPEETAEGLVEAILSLMLDMRAYL